MATEELKCDCCGKPALGVASSALGAISFAFCKDCIQNNAEPEMMLEYVWETAGEEVAECVHRITTWDGDKYITWADFVKNKRGADTGE